MATAVQCLDAGAQFLTGDGLHPAVTEFAALEGIVTIPGALTPTEVMDAWEARSDFVKVVPCAPIGGETYIGSLHQMFPHIPLIASGGVDQLNATNFIIAGAIAVGVGRELIPPDAIRRRQRTGLANWPAGSWALSRPAGIIWPRARQGERVEAVDLAKP